MAKKYAGMAVDLGCWIPRPPCFVDMDASKDECSGMALLDVIEDKK